MERGSHEFYLGFSKGKPPSPVPDCGALYTAPNGATTEGFGVPGRRRPVGMLCALSVHLSVWSRSELSQRHCSGINPAPAPQPSIQPAQRASFIFDF